MKNNQSGAVMFFALVTLLSMTAIASAMYMGSLMSVQTAKNYRNRVVSYYAADGMVTKLAQIVIDYNYQRVAQYCPDSTGTGVDTTFGGFLVKYNMTRMDPLGNRYLVKAKSYKQRVGYSSDTLFPTTLNQDIQRKKESGWFATPESTVTIPVTFYDFRFLSKRNPDFGHTGWYEVNATSNPGDNGSIKGMVDSILGPNRKPVPRISATAPGYTEAQMCFDSIAWRRDRRVNDGPTYGSIPFWSKGDTTCRQAFDAYWDTTPHGSWMTDSATYYPNGWYGGENCNACRKAVWDRYRGHDCDSCKARYPNWFHSSHISRWFWPSGTSTAVYDPKTARYTAGLQPVPGQDAWFGSNYDPALWTAPPQCGPAYYPREADSMENIVIYDSLKFWRNVPWIEAELAAGRKIDSAAPQFNWYRFPYHRWWALNRGHRCYDTAHLGVPEDPGSWGKNTLFNPIRNRGFKDDMDNYIGNNQACTNVPCVAAPSESYNHGWAMELHSQFIYVSGKQQRFLYDGYDWVGDLWVFINNKLVVDKGAMSGSGYVEVWLDSVRTKCSLQGDSTYNFDVFFTNRQLDPRLSMETNLLAWRPAKPQQRFWRRDYGPLD